MLLTLLLSACQQAGFNLPPAADQFSQSVAYNNKVDLVILSDNSSSMLTLQQDLASTVPGLISSLDRLGMDYHIAVVTTDVRAGGNGGKFIGSTPYLKVGDANLVAELQKRIIAGESGSDLEQGLESIYSALSPSSLAQMTPNFLREDGLLALVILSNEDDYSIHVTPTGFINFMDNLKKPFPSGAKSWIANYIGLVSLSESCTTRVGFKEIGLKYLQVVQASGGSVDSICQSDLSHAGDDVRVRISQILTDYHLSQSPDVSTIKVTINGLVIPQSDINGWSYIKDTNVIRFNGTSVPAVHDNVKVDFTPAQAS